MLLPYCQMDTGRNGKIKNLGQVCGGHLTKKAKKKEVVDR